MTEEVLQEEQTFSRRVVRPSEYQNWDIERLYGIGWDSPKVSRRKRIWSSTESGPPGRNKYRHGTFGQLRVWTSHETSYLGRQLRPYNVRFSRVSISLLPNHDLHPPIRFLPIPSFVLISSPSPHRSSPSSPWPSFSSLTFTLARVSFPFSQSLVGFTYEGKVGTVLHVPPTTPAQFRVGVCTEEGTENR